MMDVKGASGNAGPLGILACAGPLPIEVAQAGVRQGRKVHIVAIDGFAGPGIAHFPHERVSLGQLGRMLSSFHRAGVAEIVIAGGMERPNLLALRIDWGFVRHLPTILALTRGGDDSVLRRIVRFFEAQGFAVVGASDVAPGLLARAGPLTRIAPGPDQQTALERAARLIEGLGSFDIGQAVVARPDGIVAIEGARGTDAMLGDLAPEGPGSGLAEGGVLVKLAKPGQEMRIDLPTIGPETVRRAEAAGLTGIAVGADAAIVLERERVVEMADAAGLFVLGLESRATFCNGTMNDAGADVVQGNMLRVAARRAPTPADRRDIAIGRRLLAEMRVHGAGAAAVVSREHVRAVSGRLPLPAMVATQARSQTWGRRAVKSRIGVLVIDGEVPAGERSGEALLDAPLFLAAMESRLAGIVLLGGIADAERRSQIEAWANEAGVFLMVLEGEP
jgi:DUF1009 family protein